MVVNFVAEYNVDRWIDNPEISLETNVIGTRILLDDFRKDSIQGFNKVLKKWSLWGLKTRYTKDYTLDEVSASVAVIAIDKLTLNCLRKR